MKKLTMFIASIFISVTIFAGTGSSKSIQTVGIIGFDNKVKINNPYEWVKYGSIIMTEQSILITFMDKGLTKTESISEYDLTTHKKKGEPGEIFEAKFDNEKKGDVLALELETLYSGKEGYYSVGENTIRFYPNHGEYYVLILLK